VFLSASEHEGFCVPLVEAFYQQVPVIAYAATAVPWTMHGGGVLYRTKDPVAVAALIDSVVADDGAMDAVVRSQNEALDRLRAEDFPGTLMRQVATALSAPRRTCEVAFDFWQQVDTYERLKALKQLRPALYEALPLAEVRGQASEARSEVAGTRDDRGRDD
jgi:hypothetical protein